MRRQGGHVEVKSSPGRGVEKHEVKTDTPTREGTLPARHPRSLMSTFDDMERWMEESLHRPFLFDFGMRPFSRLFHDLNMVGEVLPSVDIFEEGHEVVVKAEMPGMRREDIDVRLEENRLIITGEKKNEEKVERKDYYRLERSYGSFNRTLLLPEGIRSENATATFRDGILEIRIPREEGHTRKITVE